MKVLKNSCVRCTVLTLSAALLFLVPMGCDDESDGSSPEPISVFAKNLYCGFDVDPLMGVEDPSQIPFLAAEAFAQLQANDIHDRAEAMAGWIFRERPHLIGLQEVSLIRIQSPGDAVMGGTTPAETVVYDYLQILLDALAEKGMAYKVAGCLESLDVELPMVVSMDPLAFDDMRLTDRDVVLARCDVAVSNVEEVLFDARTSLPTLGIEVPRGYVAVDADLPSGVKCRFVSAHLEDIPFEDIQFAQANELVASLAAETRPVILVGDFNSPAPDGLTANYLTSQGYHDAWLLDPVSQLLDGNTWGHDPDLRNAEANLTMRIDLILVRTANPGTVVADVWGDDAFERTRGGLWPSDHAGVKANFLSSWMWN